MGYLRPYAHLDSLDEERLSESLERDLEEEHARLSELEFLLNAPAPLRTAGRTTDRNEVLTA